MNAKEFNLFGEIKVVELMVEILDALRNNISLEDFNHKINLENKFDRQTICAAFSIVFEKTCIISKKKLFNTKSMRVFSNEEFLFLGSDNANYLIYLLNIGLIDKEDMEFIIEQLSIYPEDKISKEEINLIILLIIVEKSSNVLPGSRVTLIPSDTIN